MFYYKTNSEIFVSPMILPFDQITKEEYDTEMEIIQQLRQEAETDVTQQTQIKSLLSGNTVVIK